MSNDAESRDLSTELSTAYLWREFARADYALVREFADHFDAHMPRSTGCQRVAWGDSGEVGFGIILPDLVPPKDLRDDEWYIYNVEMESLARHGRRARKAARALILPDCVDDWVDLLRQALRDTVFNLCYDVSPTYVDALGETEIESTGCQVRIVSCAPQAISVARLELSGDGDTAEQAARECCRQWLAAHLEASTVLA